jgi:hypothetical protein
MTKDTGIRADAVLVLMPRLRSLVVHDETRLLLVLLPVDVLFRDAVRAHPHVVVWSRSCSCSVIAGLLLLLLAALMRCCCCARSATATATAV